MAKWCFGIDLGGTTVKCALFQTDGIVEEKWEIVTRTENNGEAILPDIAATILAKIEEKKIDKAEVAGIGIIDVKTLFGVESVKDTQSIDLVIKLEEWDKDREYDRLGLEEEYTEFLGNRVVCHSLPIRPGRNLAVIVESAAVNHRQKKMGYNAAQELYRRVQENMSKKRKEEDE